MKDLSDYSLKGHNTFGMDVKCRRFIEFDTEDEVSRVVSGLTEADRPLLVVLHSAIRGRHAVRMEGSVFLRCGSGEKWDDIVKLCVDNGLYGAENLSLIPGDVGASAVQNIGAYGVEAKDLIYKVEAIDIETGVKREFTNDECEYSYRWSKFKGEWKNRYVITYVTYKLSDIFVPHLQYGNILAELDKKGIKTPTVSQMRNVVIEIRKAKLPDPEIEGNAGSFFTNPIVDNSKYEQLVGEFGTVPHYQVGQDKVKIPAGWMIEQCGWKGKTLGKAGVHSKQALVLVNKGGANGQDIVKLCNAIRKDVKDKFGIEINPEVNIF